MDTLATNDEDTSLVSQNSPYGSSLPPVSQSQQDVSNNRAAPNSKLSPSTAGVTVPSPHPPILGAAHEQMGAIPLSSHGNKPVSQLEARPLPKRVVKGGAPPSDL